MRRSPSFLPVPLIVAALALSASRAAASWPADTTSGLPVSRANSNQYEPVVIADGAGGFITVWSDLRKYPTFDIDLYARRVTAAGDTLWDPNGTAVCTATGDVRYPSAIPDGNGGAFIAWTDLRNSFPGTGIFAQHLDANGQPLWTANGIRLSPNFYSGLGPHLCSDGAGGFLVTWGTGPLSSGGTTCQRFDGSGTKLWTLDTALRSGSTSVPYSIIPDGSNGAMVVLGFGSGGDVIAQRVSASGALPWGPNGINVCTATGVQTPGPMVSDGAGGFIVAWTDARNGNNDIFAQRVSSTGVPQWAADGVPVCGQSAGQTLPVIRALPASNVVIAWRDERGGGFTPYAQRLAADGTALWTADGVPVSAPLTYVAYDITIVPANGDSSYVTWNNTTDQVRVQKLDGGGQRLWGPLGLPVIHVPAAPGFQHNIPLEDGLGGLFVVYQYQGAGGYDLAAQHLSGNAGGPVVDVPASVGALGGLRSTPNPWRREVDVAFATRAVAGDRIEVLDITGRRVAGASLTPGATHWSWDGRDRDGGEVDAGIYLLRFVGREGSATAHTARIE